jgi:(hydroxyamino)benzene mutase
MTDTAEHYRSSPGGSARHPLDPDTARSTKAATVLALGIAAVVTGPLLGGVVPATLGVLLARQARGDLIASRGYLTGSRPLRAGLILAWIGLALAAAALVTASVFGLLALADGATRDFPDTTN